MNHFILDTRLENSSDPIIDLPLCNVRLKNNQHYPWVILIPRVNAVTEIFELEKNQQAILMNEINHISRCMNNYFKPDKLNIGALGNIVSQLHIHVIARFQHDLLWPHSVWQAALTEKNYTDDERKTLINTLHTVFS